jgi:hypothetical protein
MLPLSRLPKYIYKPLVKDALITPKINDIPVGIMVKIRPNNEYVAIYQNNYIYICSSKSRMGDLIQIRKNMADKNIFILLILRRDDLGPYHLMKNSFAISYNKVEYECDYDPDNNQILINKFTKDRSIVYTHIYQDRLLTHIVYFNKVIDLKIVKEYEQEHLFRTVVKYKNKMYVRY